MSEVLVTREQRELVDALVRPLDALFPLSRLHESGDREREQWRQIAELGWLGVSLPESAGGAGLTAVEDALMFEHFGRKLMGPGVFATVAAAAVAAGTGDGTLAHAFATGSKTAALGLVARGAAEGALVDPKDAQFALVLDVEAARLFPVASIRSGQWCATGALWSLPMEGAQFADPTHGTSDLKVTGLARLLLAAQLTGIAQAALTMAVDYAGIRRQFGQPIGSFQAIKHHCANMSMQALAATDLLSFAAVALAQGREDAGFQILSAQNVAVRAARHNANLNVQIHGGMGFSDEGNAHLFVKRAELLVQGAGGMAAVRSMTSKAAAPA
jgi:alkylation response protein AidB-like acyl-CoA dehydrogenase